MSSSRFTSCKSPPFRLQRPPDFANLSFVAPIRSKASRKRLILGLIGLFVVSTIAHSSWTLMALFRRYRRPETDVSWACRRNFILGPISVSASKLSHIRCPFAKLHFDPVSSSQPVSSSMTAPIVDDHSSSAIVPGEITAASYFAIGAVAFTLEAEDTSYSIIPVDAP